MKNATGVDYGGFAYQCGAFVCGGAMNALDKIVEMFPGRLDKIDLSAYRDDTYQPRVKCE